jgi:hypothetical protein
MSSEDKKGFIVEVMNAVQRIGGFDPNPHVKESDIYDQVAHSTSKSAEQAHLPSPDRSEPHHSQIAEILKDAKIRNILFTSNVFILGRIGYFDRIVKQLVDAYQKYERKEISVIHTEPELRQYKDQSKDSVLPFVLIPAARNREDLSHLVTLALEMHVPLWMVALPSQFEKQLLLSFESLFVSLAPKTDMNWLFEIIDVQPDHKQELYEEKIKAILLIGSHINKRGKSTETGYTFAISKL